MTTFAAGVDFIGNSFDPKFISNYRLVLSLSERSLLYALLNTSNEVVVLRKYENASSALLGNFLEQVRNADHWLKSRFANVQLIYVPGYWLLVPSEFLPNGSEAAYLENVYGLDIAPDVVIHRDFHRNLKLHNIYVLDPILEQVCNEYFPSAEYKHIVSLALEAHWRIVPALVQVGTPITAGLLLLEDVLICSVMKENELLFCNLFHYNSTEDILYYLSSVVACLELRPMDMQLFLSGNPIPRQTATELLKNYFNLTDIRPFLPKQLSLNKHELYHEDFPHIFATTF